MKEPLSGKDANDLVTLILCADAAKGAVQELPLVGDWQQIVRWATLFRDRAEENGYTDIQFRRR